MADYTPYAASYPAVYSATYAPTKPRPRKGATPVVQLSAMSIAENATINSVVGVLSVANLGGRTVSSWSVTSDPDNKFAISGSNLIIDQTLDYETKTSHYVAVQATLSDASTVSGSFTITVTNVLDAATLGALSLSANTIAENSAVNTFVAQVNGKTVGSTLSLTDTAGGRFKLVGIEIFADTVATDYETATSHSITIRETLADSPNSPRDNTFTINVTNVTETEPLAALVLSASTIAENSAEDTLVGSILNIMGGSTLSLADNAGGRFKITGASLYAGATPTDYESATSHGIVIRETLATSPNSPRDTSLTVTVTDVVEGGGGAPSLIFNVASNSQYIGQVV